MTARYAELESSRQFSKAQNPKDSATLIIVRHDGAAPRVLMGERHGSHAFMPNKFVFPGGRLDAADCRTRIARDLHPAVLEKIAMRMRGRSSVARARGLAVAALRETYEETGLVLGRSIAGDNLSWGEIVARQTGPDLSGLRLFARAITPPGRTRRFDSRFFVIDARHFGNLDRPLHPGSGELLETRWFSFAEAMTLALPEITLDMLTRLAPLMANARELEPGGPLCFQYFKGKSWREETL